MDNYFFMLYFNSNIIFYAGDKVKDKDSFRLTKKNQMGYTGLENMKDGLINICYQNSLIQALFATEDLLKELVFSPIEYNMDYGEITMLSELQKVFTRLYYTDRPTISTHEVSF